MKNKNSTKQQLLELEEFLLQPNIRKSPDELSKLLSDEFIEFGSSGKVFTKKQIIDTLQEEATIQMSIHDFQTKELASNTILATYQIFKQVETGEQKVTSLRSSIWSIIDNRWQMIFHQGTPTTNKE